jgi:low affinity Fe/Cu permease
MEKFSAVARRVSELAGKPATFLAAVALILIWAACGPLFGFSDTWQLIVNTSTTIITFLMVFVLQSSQNRSERAVHAKLDELICASERANNQLIDIENDTEQHLAQVQDAARAQKT